MHGICDSSSLAELLSRRMCACASAANDLRSLPYLLYGEEWNVGYLVAYTQHQFHNNFDLNLMYFMYE